MVTLQFWLSVAYLIVNENKWHHWSGITLNLPAVVVQTLSCVQLFATPSTAACQASLTSTISRNLLKLMSAEVVMPSILSSAVPLLLLSSIFPRSGSFPMSQFFTSGGQSIGVSASVLPMNIQGWFPLELASLISLLSKGLSRKFLLRLQYLNFY